MLGPEDHLVVGGHVAEELEDVDLLLEVRADHVVVRVPGDGQDRGVIELGVVEAVEQVDGPGPAGGEADAQPPGELGVAAGGEGRRLLVPALDEADLVLVLAQGLEDPVDPVAGQAEGRVHAPVDQLLDDHVARGLRHLSASSRCLGKRRGMNGGGERTPRYDGHLFGDGKTACSISSGRASGARTGAEICK